MRSNRRYYFDKFKLDLPNYQRFLSDSEYESSKMEFTKIELTRKQEKELFNSIKKMILAYNKVTSYRDVYSVIRNISRFFKIKEGFLKEIFKILPLRGSSALMDCVGEVLENYKKDNLNVQNICLELIGILETRTINNDDIDYLLTIDCICGLVQNLINLDGYVEDTLLEKMLYLGRKYIKKEYKDPYKGEEIRASIHSAINNCFHYILFDTAEPFNIEILKKYEELVPGEVFYYIAKGEYVDGNEETFEKLKGIIIERIKKHIVSEFNMNPIPNLNIQVDWDMASSFLIDDVSTFRWGEDSGSDKCESATGF